MLYSSYYYLQEKLIVWKSKSCSFDHSLNTLHLLIVSMFTGFANDFSCSWSTFLFSSFCVRLIKLSAALFNDPHFALSVTKSGLIRMFSSGDFISAILFVSLQIRFFRVISVIEFQHCFITFRTMVMISSFRQLKLFTKTSKYLFAVDSRRFLEDS